MTDHTKHITVTTGKKKSIAYVTGTRIKVYDVLSYVSTGMPHEDIVSNFPPLTETDIQACIAYAADKEKQFFVDDEEPSSPNE